MTNEKFDLDEGQRSLLALCVGIAVEKFGENVKVSEAEVARFRESAELLRGSSDSFDRAMFGEATRSAINIQRLADQFHRQIAEATALRVRLEQADEITVGEAQLEDDDCPVCTDEPDEDAIRTTDHVSFYQYGKLAFNFFGSDEDRPLAYLATGKGTRIDLTEGATVEAAIRAFCDQQQFWPDCWFISDHGNAHRIDLTVKEVK